jgi:hypothetical protein
MQYSITSIDSALNPSNSYLTFYLILNCHYLSITLHLYVVVLVSYVYIYMYIYMCIYIYTYICIHKAKIANVSYCLLPYAKFILICTVPKQPT